MLFFGKPYRFTLTTIKKRRAQVFPALSQQYGCLYLVLPCFQIYKVTLYTAPLLGLGLWPVPHPHFKEIVLWWSCVNFSKSSLVAWKLPGPMMPDQMFPFYIRYFMDSISISPSQGTFQLSTPPWGWPDSPRNPGSHMFTVVWGLWSSLVQEGGLNRSPQWPAWYFFAGSPWTAGVVLIC